MLAHRPGLVERGLLGAPPVLMQRHFSRHDPLVQHLLYQADVRVAASTSSVCEDVASKREPELPRQAESTTWTPHRPGTMSRARSCRTALSGTAVWSAGVQEQTAQKKSRMRTRNVAGSLFTTNRRGQTLCADFQRGECASTRGSSLCPKAPSSVHHCAKCLGESHGSDRCTRTDVQV